MVQADLFIDKWFVLIRVSFVKGNLLFFCDESDFGYL